MKGALSRMAGPVISGLTTGTAFCSGAVWVKKYLRVLRVREWLPWANTRPMAQNWSSSRSSGSSRAGQAASPPGGGLAAVLGTTITLVTVLLGSSSVLPLEPQKYLAERRMVRRRRRLRSGLLT